MSSQDVMSMQDAFDLAMQCEDRGEHENAIALLKQLHDLVPHDPECLHSIGIIKANMRDFDGAVPYLWEAVRRQCSIGNLRDLLTSLLGADRLVEADSVCRATGAITETDAELLGLWGYALMSLGRHAEAVAILEKAAGIDPDLRHHGIRHNLSISLVELGEGEQAVAAFSRIVKPWDGETAGIDPEIHYSLHATGYDDKRIHRSFSNSLVEHYWNAVPRRAFGRVLDLGCGTGLVALRVASSATAITGIDISAEMLAQARAKGGYDRLVRGDLAASMAELSDGFDTILSACALYHIADLRPVFREVARLLAPGGIFAFSVDPTSDEGTIGVTGAGEFCHSRRYLRGLAFEYGLAERSIVIGAHRATPGFWCVFAKAGDPVGPLH